MNCNPPDDIVIYSGFACNPTDCQMQTVFASVSDPYSIKDFKVWEVTCVSGESQAIAVVQCCEK